MLLDCVRLYSLWGLASYGLLVGCKLVEDRCLIVILLDNVSLAGSGLGQLLVRLEHLLEHEQQAEHLVLACDRQHDLRLRLENG